MQPAEVGQGDNLTRVGQLGSAALGCILLQRQGRLHRVIVSQVRSDGTAQMLLFEDDYVIEAFSADRFDHLLGLGILPRRVRGNPAQKGSSEGIEQGNEYGSHAGHATLVEPGR